MQDKTEMTKPYGKQKATAGVMLGAMFILVGCGGDESSTGANAALSNINSPAQIAQESADNYDENVNGVITGSTLARWVSDWENERPEGIEGRLIILQNTAGAEGTEYIKPVPGKVYTYLVGSAEWFETRSNGVTETVTMVNSGARMDALLKDLDIDPRKDMLVCAMGTGGTGQSMGQGRCWYTLRYWGVESTNLAILNGDNAWQLASGQMPESAFSDTASERTSTGRVSVRDLPADNTALMATIDDMMEAVTPVRGNDLNDGVMIWDARSLRQYSAGEQIENGFAGCASAYCSPAADFNYMTTFQNGGARQGHPNGTLQLQFTRMLVPGEGYRYKDKAELQAYVDGYVDDLGIGFVDNTYQPVGQGRAYQDGDTVITYCETTMRAMVTGTVSAVILGLPTRFYDGAMTEWNSLSHSYTSQGTPILPEDSPWRSDLDDISFFRSALSSENIRPRPIDDPYAANAKQIVQADREYKMGGGSAGSGSSGGGIALPSNPCGG